MNSINELKDLNNKWALITGGAGHIGKAAAETLLECGACVILLDRDESALKLAKDHFKHYADKVHTLCSDLSNENDIRSAMVEVEKISGRQLNILINNAAFVGTDNLEGWCVPFEKQSFSTFKSCLDVNLSAPFLLSQLCFILFNQHQYPLKTVINISSIYGIVGPQMELYEGTDMGNPAAYAVSKAGLMQLSKWMACIAAPDIRVNNIVLGGVFRGQDESFLQKYNKKVPLKRMATEEDIKGAILYLSSPLSNYMTGQSIILDGGWCSH